MIPVEALAAAALTLFAVLAVLAANFKEWTQ